MGRGGETKIGDLGIDWRGELSLRDLSKAFAVDNDKKIVGVNLEAVVKISFPELTDPASCYAVERYLRATDRYLTDNWRVESERGYYGDETQVLYDWGVCNEVQEQVGELVTLPLDKQVERSLALEYGYIPDELATLAWQVEEIALDCVDCGPYLPLDTQMVSQYTYSTWANYDFRERQLPYATVIPNGPIRYRLIDGRLRIAAARRKQLASVPMLVGRR